MLHKYSLDPCYKTCLYTSISRILSLQNTFRVQILWCSLCRHLHFLWNKKMEIKFVKLKKVKNEWFTVFLIETRQSFSWALVFFAVIFIVLTFKSSRNIWTLSTFQRFLTFTRSIILITIIRIANTLFLCWLYATLYFFKTSRFPYIGSG